jgi:hypothetical protein
LAPSRGRVERGASNALGDASASICGANPFERRCYFPFTGKRNALTLAVLGATAAAWDAVKRARHNRFAGGRVPIKNTCRAEVEALEVEEATLAFDGGKPREALSLTARHRVLILS